MNKNEFLQELRGRLNGFPEQETAKTLEYYAEMIDDAVEDGASEEYAVSRLGNIDEIAKKIIDEIPIRALVKADFKRRKPNAAAIVLLLLGSPIWVPLITAAIAVLISFYLALWSILASFFVTAAVLAVTAAAAVIAIIVFAIPRPEKAVFALGLTLLCGGLAYLCFILAILLSKLLIKFTVFILRKIKGLFIKQGRD